MSVVPGWVRTLAVVLLLAGCGGDPKPSINGSLVESKDSRSGASVLSTPTITFARPLQEEAPYREEVWGWPVRATLDSMRMTNQGQDIGGAWSWLEEGKIAVFVPSGLLPSGAQLTVEAIIRYEVERDGKWEPAMYQGKPVETVTFPFTTAAQPEAAEKLTLTLSPTAGGTDVSPAVDIIASSSPRLYREVVLKHSSFPVRTELEDLALFQGTTRLAARFDSSVGAGDDRPLEVESLLPPHQLLRAVAKVHWARKLQGTWTPIEGSTQTLEVSFTTADYDPLAGVRADNIGPSWPTPRQLYFLWKEYSEGQIQLKRKQDAILGGLEQQTLEARFTRPSGTVQTVPATYAPDSRTFHFAIPTGLQPATIYVLRLVARPQSGPERTVLEVPFRTSLYATFSEKWDAVTAITPTYFKIPRSAGVQVLGVQFSDIPENFDAFETRQRGGLVQGEPVWEGTPWYEKTVYPLVYRELLSGNGKLKLTWDRPSDLGLPPKHEAYLGTRPRVLTDEEVTADHIQPQEADRYVSVNHDVMDHVLKDHDDLLQQAANHPERETDPWLKLLLSSGSPYLEYGLTYRVRLWYAVPGKPAPLTERFVDIQNP